MVKDDRFWAKVDKGDPSAPDDCWIWAGATSRGYGQLKGDAKLAYAHRFSYEKHNGSIPPGMFVCHRCDTKLCVKPSHLFLGEHKDNMRDMVEKGRQARGEASPAAVLTWETVRLIRALYVKGSHELGLRALARRFGVSWSQIHHIVTGCNWKESSA